MGRSFTNGCVFALWCSGAFGQAPAPRQEFEAAVMKLNTSGQTDASFKMLPSGLFSATNIRMIDIFQFAFKVRNETTVGVPGWFNSDRFDVTGRAEANSKEDTFREMLGTLLMQEFKLKVHIQPTEMSAYALVVGKGGPKLAKAAGTDEPTCKPLGDQGPQFGGAHRACTNLKMSDLAEALPDLAPGYVTKTVVDQTGLTGSYDFRLDWVGRNNIDTVGGLTMFGAVEKLGLKLEEKKLTLPVVVIDHVERLVGN
jgi:uncharacterized protein (TIGR03435 family)